MQGRLLNVVVLVPADRADLTKDLPTLLIRLHPDRRSTDEGLAVGTRILIVVGMYSTASHRTGLLSWDLDLRNQAQEIA